MFYNEDTPWDEDEVKHLDEFMNYLRKNQLLIPRENFPDQEILRNLLGAGYNYQKAYQDIMWNLNWRTKNMPIPLLDEDVHLLERGVVSVFGRDRFYRPIFLIRPTIKTDV